MKKILNYFYLREYGWYYDQMEDILLGKRQFFSWNPNWRKTVNWEKVRKFYES